MDRAILLEGYETPKQTAARWGMTQTGVNYYLMRGRVPGARRFGRQWIVPRDAPVPERLRPGRKAAAPTPGPQTPSV